MDTSESMEDMLERVPSLNEDPAERKRLLGLLAQRRYRQRKRQQRPASSKRPVRTHKQRDTTSARAVDRNSTQTTTVTRENMPHFQMPGDAEVDALLAGLFDLAGSASQGLLGCPPLADFGALHEMSQSPGLSNHSSLDPYYRQDTASDFVAGLRILPELEPALSHASYRMQHPFTASDGLSAILSTRAKSLSPFADESYISAPILGLVRAHVTILKLIKGPGSTVDTIWNPFAESPSYMRPLEDHTTSLAPFEMLPPNYVPSAAQRTVAHHPVIDLLPWPSVREKLLQLLMLPPSFRPRKLQDEQHNIAMQLKFDMMDVSGGIRVRGMDPFHPDNWEIGQTFFEEWWWALNREIVSNSNALRRSRGQQDLVLRKRVY